MKKFGKILLTLMITAAMLLCSCNENPTEEPDVTTEAGGTAAPEFTPSKHEITVSEARSILAANELRTNINKWTTEACAYHGGQQMRVCHTERGTYAAFARDYGDGDGIEKFYVTKTDNEGKSSVLYYGGIFADDGTITVNIAQNTNGDIIVTATSHKILAAYIFDGKTDEMTKYDSTPVFSSGETAGYGQVMFDFDNQKIYSFTAAGTWSSEIGDFLLEWFSFDINTKQWSENSTYLWMEDIGRHCYMYPFPDGNGGAYIVSQRDEKTEFLEGVFSMAGMDTYVWDRIDLFHIPDLTAGENVTCSTVQLEDDSLGLEGIWSVTNHAHNGDVYVDSNGYMHITYRHSLSDYTGTHAPFDNKLEYRHAVYDGMECIFNEQLSMPEIGCMYYKPMVRQGTDGKLYLIVAKLWGENGVEFNFYTAKDEHGREWNLEKTVTVGDGTTAHSLNLSAVRDGSIQDGVLSCFYYGSGGSGEARRGYTFNISLSDFSATEVKDILEGYPIGIDDVRYDERVPASAHQSQIVRTENGTYAAFVYNYNHNDEKEEFYIVKIDGDGMVTVLESGSYGSTQNKYISINQMPDGMIYVSLPTGYTMYVIDPATDEVRLCETGSHTGIFDKIAQMDYIYDAEGEPAYVLTSNYDFGVMGYGFDTESLSMQIKGLKKYNLDREIVGNYIKLFTLSDQKGGAYMVGTREVWKNDLDGKLVYDNVEESISDSLMLFYIPDLSEGKVISCADISLPYEAEGGDGIWSVINVADNGDVYLGSDGNLHVFYTYYHYDYDYTDADKNAELTAKTLKHCHAVYRGTELVSEEELKIDSLTDNSAVKMIETEDGTPYLMVCNLGEESTKIDVYCETESDWALTMTKKLGDFSPEAFSISKTVGDTVDCLVYADNNDLYYTSIAFK